MRSLSPAAERQRIRQARRPAWRGISSVTTRRGPFFRNRRARFLTLTLPVLFLVIFALVFTGTAKVAGGSIGTSLYQVPGIITLAIISAAFGNPGPRPGPLLLHT